MRSLYYWTCFIKQILLKSLNDNKATAEGEVSRRTRQGELGSGCQGQSPRGHQTPPVITSPEKGIPVQPMVRTLRQECSPSIASSKPHSCTQDDVKPKHTTKGVRHVVGDEPLQTKPKVISQGLLVIAAKGLQ